MDILVSTRGIACFITLNRPQALNALTLPMVLAMAAALDAANRDPAVQQIVLASSSAKAFCAGGDVRAATQHKDQPEIGARFFRAEYELNYAIATSPKSVIALVDGICMGGGLGLACHAAYTVASEPSLWAMPELAIGLFPDVGAGYFLNQCADGFGEWFTLSGARIEGAQAVAAGLADVLVTSAQLADVMSRLEREGAAEILATFTPAPAPTLPQPRWEREYAPTGSPTSIRLTQQHLTACKGLSLRAVLQRDYRLACGCLRGHDFYEGVRALLIDKDKSPRWQPATLAAVTQEQLEKHLAPPFGPELFES